MSGQGAAPQRLRIAVLNRVFAARGGGAERYSLALVEQLAASHEIHVFAQDIEHAHPKVQYHRLSRPPVRTRWINQLWYAWVSWRATRTGFDVVHAHENTWHGQVQTVHVRLVRATLFEGRSDLRRALRWFKVLLSPRLLAYLGLERARFAAQPGRRVLAVSQTLADEVLACHPGVAPMLGVLTPGVDLPAAPPMDAAAARRSLGLPEGGRWLLLVANDYARKGLDALLQSLSLLPPDVHLAVAGQPGQAARYQALAAQAGLADRLHLLGSLPDLAPAFAAADVLAHPTLEDSFAMAPLEAMAHGLPVVVSGPAWCGLATLLTDGQQALLLKDPRDAQALADALLKVLDDAPLRAQLVQGGLALASEHQWSAVAQRQEAVYLAVAIERSRR